MAAVDMPAVAGPLKARRLLGPGSLVLLEARLRNKVKSYQRLLAKNRSQSAAFD